MSSPANERETLTEPGYPLTPESHLGSELGISGRLDMDNLPRLTLQLLDREADEASRFSYGSELRGILSTYGIRKLFGTP